MDTGVAKDVQEQLARERKRKRAAGEVPYPVDYSTDMADHDNWDHLFMTRLCRRLTLHEFVTPPRRVLDLGCGGGLWVIEAAAQWETAHFVGLDMKNLQPSTDELQETSFKHLAPRIKWVHANLLDRLPLSSDHFDFVRICRIGLGVPEDEWPDVLEEVHRVLTPGGILEIIEEDLFFPCDRTPNHIPSSTASTSMYINPSSAVNTVYTNSTMVTPPLRSLKGNFPPPSPAGSDPCMHYPATFLSADYTRPGHRCDLCIARPEDSVNSLNGLHADELPFGRASDQSPSNASSAYLPSEPRPNIRDHSRLKASWEALIERRFLARQPTSILQLYLSSTFVDIQARPALQIPLPSNSKPPQPDDSYGDDDVVIGDADDGFFEMTDDEDFVDISRLASLISSPEPNHRRASSNGQVDCWSTMQRSWVDAWAPMHLASVVRTIQGCKEAIWHEYQDLYEPDICWADNSLREDFEMFWENWNNDMLDRIGMRGRLAAQTGWAEPVEGPDPGPDWRLWRQAVTKDDQRTGALDAEGAPAAAPASGPTPAPALNLCRSFRGFVAWKAGKTPMALKEKGR